MAVRAEVEGNDPHQNDMLEPMLAMAPMLEPMLEHNNVAPMLELTQF